MHLSGAPVLQHGFCSHEARVGFSMLLSSAGGPAFHTWTSQASLVLGHMVPGEGKAKAGSVVVSYTVALFPSMAQEGESKM